MKNNKITTSKEVIDYLKKNLKKEGIVTMFIAGSQPENIVPQSDFDIFIVVKSEKRNRFFRNLTRTMNNFVKNRPGVIYSFYRAPIKYKNKGLIHFVIYLDKLESFDKNYRARFTNEMKRLLLHVNKHHTLLYGEKISNLIKDIKFTNDELKADVESIKRHYKQFKKQKAISYGEWKPVKGRWLFVNTTRYPSKFLRDTLTKYYEKHLNDQPKP